MKVIVCGSRDWSDPYPIRLMLAAFENKPVELIHGAARGADRLAGMLAEEYRIPVTEFPADFEKLLSQERRQVGLPPKIKRRDRSV